MSLMADWNSRSFTACMEWDPDTSLYVGTIPGITGAHSQGSTLDELRSNLQEVVELCIEEHGAEAGDLP